MKRKMSTGVRPEYSDMTVLDFLSNRFTYHSKSRWDDLIRDGKIKVNGVVGVSGKLVRTGDVVAYENDATEEPPVIADYTVLFEDSDLLVVNKSGNLPCHPAGRYFSHTLWYLVKENLGLDYLSFINRIDRETSGIVLISKSALASKICGDQFRAGTVIKRYLAIVEGEFPEEAVRAEGFLYGDESSPVRKKRRFILKDNRAESLPDAETCSTVFCCIGRYDDMSLVEAELQTGRFHQIRATLCSLGYPVVGDKVYGVDDNMFIKFIEDRLTEDDRRRLRLPRQALHAATLGIIHPVSGKEMQWHVSMPEDMKSLFPDIHDK